MVPRFLTAILCTGLFSGAFRASYHADRCVVTTDGARLEISFPGLTMGSFSGDVRFTIYRGLTRHRAADARLLLREPRRRDGLS
jgi:hypothetical protein